jgi:hypothetical protein
MYNISNATGTGVSYSTAQPYMACSADSVYGLCLAGSWGCTAENVARTCSTFPSAGQCTGLARYPNATVAAYGSITGVAAMQAEILARGPVACVVDDTWLLNYTGGVLSAPGVAANHAVSVAGWGVLENVSYWRVRNSWGDYWGEMGWARVAFGAVLIETQCSWATPGTFTEANYPCLEDGTNCAPAPTPPPPPPSPPPGTLRWAVSVMDNATCDTTSLTLAPDQNVAFLSCGRRTNESADFALRAVAVATGNVLWTVHFPWGYLDDQHAPLVVASADVVLVAPIQVVDTADNTTSAVMAAVWIANGSVAWNSTLWERPQPPASFSIQNLELVPARTPEPVTSGCILAVVSESDTNSNSHRAFSLGGTGLWSAGAQYSGAGYSVTSDFTTMIYYANEDGTDTVLAAVWLTNFTARPITCDTNNPCGHHFQVTGGGFVVWDDTEQGNPELSVLTPAADLTNTTNVASLLASTSWFKPANNETMLGGYSDVGVVSGWTADGASWSFDSPLVPPVPPSPPAPPTPPQPPAPTPGGGCNLVATVPRANLIIVGFNTTVCGLRLATGAPLWNATVAMLSPYILSMPSGLNGMPYYPAASNDSVALFDSGGNLHVLWLANGTERFNITASALNAGGTLSIDTITVTDDLSTVLILAHKDAAGSRSLRSVWVGDDCNASRFGVGCTQNCTCQHGVASSGVAGDGHCAMCNVGWAGIDCDVCDTGHFGVGCYQSCSCRLGTNSSGLNGTGACVPGSCRQAWAGANCDDCESAYFGPTCSQPCACRHGTNSSGIRGTGNCTDCSAPFWSGPDCTLCNGVADPGLCASKYAGMCEDPVNGDMIRKNCPSMCGTCSSAPGPGAGWFVCSSAGRCESSSQGVNASECGRMCPNQLYLCTGGSCVPSVLPDRGVPIDVCEKGCRHNATAAGQ